ncbi:hypothetical protein MAR_031879 [Mya arenaria]|uniref:C-type lectin domain-containing protein n=1 Tax=Mya arenaria TaxID=6604 RepID=A0ABY7F520_MYAAR|nr:hypothetical protein MAR_031879 [Mya arenaria]
MGVKMEAGLLFLAGCVLGQVCCLEEPTCSSRCEFEARISRQLAEIQHNLSSIRQERGTACRDGWVPFHGSCYLFADSDFVDFLGAEHHCRRYGAHLIHVNTEAENIQTVVVRDSGFGVGGCMEILWAPVQSVLGRSRFV